MVPSLEAVHCFFEPLAEYLDLLDSISRQAVTKKQGTIPVHLVPNLEPLAISAESWLDLSLGFGKLFHRVAGCPAAVAREAARSRRAFRAPGARLLAAAHVRRE